MRVVNDSDDSPESSNSGKYADPDDREKRRAGGSVHMTYLILPCVFAHKQKAPVDLDVARATCRVSLLTNKSQDQYFF